MEYLGHTLHEIAATKAGIIKEGGFIVLAQQEPEAAKELIRKAAEVGADVVREGIEYCVASRAVAVGGQLITITGLHDTYGDIFLPLHGKHQAANAASALVAVEAFFGDQPLDIEAVRAGFAAVTSPGRCEVVHRDPTIILDAAHNPHGAKALAETLSNEFNFDEIIAVVGVFGDKDATGILQELEQIVDHVIVTQSSSTRAMSSGELEKIASTVFGHDRVFELSNLEAAIDRAVSDATRPLSEDTIGIIMTGSVVTVGEARSYLRKRFTR
jgi:dihydrofolate synthase/folylpolyglutamate synthase